MHKHYLPNKTPPKVLHHSDKIPRRIITLNFDEMGKMIKTWSTSRPADNHTAKFYLFALLLYFGIIWKCAPPYSFYRSSETFRRCLFFGIRPFYWLSGHYQQQEGFWARAFGKTYSWLTTRPLVDLIGPPHCSGMRKSNEARRV